MVCSYFLLTIHIFKALFCTDVPYGLLQGTIVNWLFTDLGEEVGHNAIEQLEVILKKLWHIDIPDGTQTYQLLHESCNQFSHRQLYNYDASIRDKAADSTAIKGILQTHLIHVRIFPL